MMRANVANSHSVFDVEYNAQFALQLFNAYYRTPDPSGKLYASFPEFVLIKPQVLDGRELTIPSEEKKVLGDCKEKAHARSGFVGVTKYFDAKFDYHWIKLSAYPFKLGDTVDENKNEFFYLLNKFVEFTQSHPEVYGDLTADSETDHDIALMLQEIRANAAQLGDKLKLYPEAMLVSFDPEWPAIEVKKLLATLEANDQSWNQLLLEYLRYVINEKSGLAIKDGLIDEYAGMKLETHAPMAGHSPPHDMVTTGIVHRILPILTDRVSDLQANEEARALDEDALGEIPELDNTPVIAEVDVKLEEVQHEPIVDVHVATQKYAVFDFDALQREQAQQELAAAQALDSARLRAVKLSQLNVAAAEKALKMQEEKIRLEALAVVTSRKQLEDAEAACNAALARIERSQQMRRMEEEKVHELERAHLASEEAARLAVSRRAELAEQVKFEAEQRKRDEEELAERERLQLKHELELQTQIKHRLAGIGEATSAMQVRIQSEIEATHLAQELAAKHQAAVSHLAQLADESHQKRMLEEAKSQELEHARLASEEAARLAAIHRAELAEQAKLEAEQRKQAELELAEREQVQATQERELHTRLLHRLSAIGEATSAMQARIQSEIEAVHLAHELALTHQAADESQQARRTEVEKAHEFERDRLASEEAARVAAMQRAELAEIAKQEAEQRKHMEEELTERERVQQQQELELRTHVQHRLSAIDEAAAAMQARIQSEIDAVHLAQELADTHHAAVLKIAEDNSRSTVERAKENSVSGHGYNPFAYEELLTTQQEAQYDVAHSVSFQDDDSSHHQFHIPDEQSSRGNNFAWLFKGAGVGIALSALGVLLMYNYGIISGSGSVAPSVTATQTSKASVDMLVKPVAESEAYVRFDSLKMSDHLQKIPPL